MTTTHKGFRIGFIFLALLLALLLVAYRARSAGAPFMGGMMGGPRLVSEGDTPTSPETLAQMQAMATAMHGLMDDLVAAPDSATADATRQQVLAMITAMQALAGHPEGAPDPAAMLAQMEALWPTMGPMMTAMHEQMAAAGQPHDPAAMVEMMNRMARMSGMMAGPDQMPDTETMREMMPQMAPAAGD